EGVHFATLKYLMLIGFEMGSGIQAYYSYLNDMLYSIFKTKNIKDKKLKANKLIQSLKRNTLKVT
ncbi:MAG: hypothetical protein ACTH6I_06935, partial [Vibrio litoralis]|uniref:hypothetical protein n=1 Tax=Vibrio litoralis TaxID=335972 RepID=UPI003F981316